MVVRCRHAYPFQDPAYPFGLGMLEDAVGQIDLMNDFAQCLERLVPGAERLDENLECGQLPDVGELPPLDIEVDRLRIGRRRLGSLHESEDSGRIDVRADEPGRGDPVHKGAGPRDPGPALVILRFSFHDFSPGRHSSLFEPLCHRAVERLQHLLHPPAGGGGEEVGPL